MAYAIIQSGFVVNLIEASADHAASIGAVLATAGVGIGSGYANGVFTPPLPVPERAPQFVTMRQARLALMAAGLLNTVNTTIAAMPGPQGDAARIEWEFSSEVKRNQPLVMALGPTLGLTPVQLDALFIAAAKV